MEKRHGQPEPVQARPELGELQTSKFCFSIYFGLPPLANRKKKKKKKEMIAIILVFLESGLDWAGLDWDTLAGSSKWARQSRARLAEQGRARQPEQSKGQAAIRLHLNPIAILAQVTMT